MPKLARFLFACAMTAAQAAQGPSLVGEWLYRKMLYRGQELPPRDPRLELSFTFGASGEDRVYWTRDGGRTFCERKGLYAWDGRVLSDEVTWVNPANQADCAQDPDMQLGRRTDTPLDWVNGELRLHLPLGGNEIIYVWARKNAPARAL